MDIEESKLIISNSRELIPISNGLVNFQTDFSIVSLEKKPFRAIVVNQESLDNSGEVEMKNVSNGSFSGRIVKDSGKRDEWYIAVESDSQIEAKLSIHTIEIEKGKESVSDVKEENFSNHHHHHEKKKKRLSFWIIILIIGIVSIIGYIVYRFLFKKKSKEIPVPLVSESEIERDDEPIEEEIVPVRERKEPAKPPAVIIEKEEPKREVVEDEEDDIKLDFSDLPPV